MSNNVTVNAAGAFNLLVDATNGSCNDELVSMGLAIGFTQEELAAQYPDLFDSEDELDADEDDEDDKDSE